MQLAARDPSIELVSCPSTSSLPPLPSILTKVLAGGTGQLIAALKADEIDISIALTEALITGIVKKTAEYKIVGTYVTSPLNWAVIVGKDSKYQKLEDLRGEKIGISRIGRYVSSFSDGTGVDRMCMYSGSQVMASYMALKQGWVDGEGKVLPIQFESESMSSQSFSRSLTALIISPRHLQGVFASSSTGDGADLNFRISVMV